MTVAQSTEKRTLICTFSLKHGYVHSIGYLLSLRPIHSSSAMHRVATDSKLSHLSDIKQLMFNKIVFLIEILIKSCVVLELGKPLLVTFACVYSFRYGVWFVLRLISAFIVV